VEKLYSDLVDCKDLDRGVYWLKIWCEPETSVFKQNGMFSWVDIYKVRDNSYTRSYKSQKVVALVLQIF
jgi:hypothetical protein